MGRRAWAVRGLKARGARALTGASGELTYVWLLGASPELTYVYGDQLQEAGGDRGAGLGVSGEDELEQVKGSYRCHPSCPLPRLHYRLLTLCPAAY